MHAKDTKAAFGVMQYSCRGHVMFQTTTIKSMDPLFHVSNVKLRANFTFLFENNYHPNNPLASLNKPTADSEDRREKQNRN